MDTVLKINSKTLSVQIKNAFFIIRFSGEMNVVGKVLSALRQLDPQIQEAVRNNEQLPPNFISKILIMSLTPSDGMLYKEPPTVSSLFSLVEDLHKNKTLLDEDYQRMQNLKKIINPEELVNTNKLIPDSSKMSPFDQYGDGAFTKEDDFLKK